MTSILNFEKCSEVTLEVKNRPCQKIERCFTEFIFVNSSPYVISMIKSLFFNKDILYPTQSDIIESHDLSQSRFIDVSTYKI